MRRTFFVIVLVGLLSAPTVRAGLITDDIQFQNTSSNGDTVNGSFTYNDSGSSPYTVTSITLDDPFLSSALTEADPSLTFDGTSLSGTVSASLYAGNNPNEGNLYYGMTGDFSTMSNSVTFTFGLSNYTFLSDTVSGPVTITAVPSAVPEPGTILLGATAAVILGGLAFRRGQSARRVR